VLAAGSLTRYMRRRRHALAPVRLSTQRARDNLRPDNPERARILGLVGGRPILTAPDWKPDATTRERPILRTKVREAASCGSWYSEVAPSVYCSWQTSLLCQTRQPTWPAASAYYA
jgi:hypothetical protein